MALAGPGAGPRAGAAALQRDWQANTSALAAQSETGQSRDDTEHAIPSPGLDLELPPRPAARRTAGGVTAPPRPHYRHGDSVVRVRAVDSES